MGGGVLQREGERQREHIKKSRVIRRMSGRGSYEMEGVQDKKD